MVAAVYYQLFIIIIYSIRIFSYKDLYYYNRGIGTARLKILIVRETWRPQQLGKYYIQLNVEVISFILRLSK